MEMITTYLKHVKASNDYKEREKLAIKLAIVHNIKMKEIERAMIARQKKIERYEAFLYASAQAKKEIETLGRSLLTKVPVELLSKIAQEIALNWSSGDLVIARLEQTMHELISHLPDIVVNGEPVSVQERLGSFMREALIANRGVAFEPHFAQISPTMDAPYSPKLEPYLTLIRSVNITIRIASPEELEHHPHKIWAAIDNLPR